MLQHIDTSTYQPDSSRDLRDQADLNNLGTIDIALQQVGESSEQATRLLSMRDLVINFPGQCTIRTNGLSNLNGLVNAQKEDVILHARQPHLFEYTHPTSAMGGGSRLYDTTPLTGSDSLPVLSMKHGVVLINPTERIEKFSVNKKVNVTNCDLPTAFSGLGEIPEVGVKIEVTDYRTEPSPDSTHKLTISRVNPDTKVNPMDFLKWSLDPKKAK